MKKLVIALIVTIIAVVLGLRAAHACSGNANPFLESSDRAKIELQETESGSNVLSTVAFVVPTVNFRKLSDNPCFRPSDIEDEAQVCMGSQCYDINSSRSYVHVGDKKFVAKADFRNDVIDDNPTLHIRFRDFESPHYTICDLLVDAEEYEFCDQYFSDPYYKSARRPDSTKSLRGGFRMYIKDVRKVPGAFYVEIEGILKHKVDFGKQEIWVSKSTKDEGVNFVKFDNAVFEYTEFNHKSGFAPAWFRGLVIFSEEELAGKNDIRIQPRMTLDRTYRHPTINVCRDSDAQGTRLICGVPEDSFIDDWKIHSVNDLGGQYAFNILGKAKDNIYDTRIGVHLTVGDQTTPPFVNAFVTCTPPYDGGYNCWGRIVIAKRYVAMEGAQIDLTYAMGTEGYGYTFARLPIEVEAPVISPNALSLIRPAEVTHVERGAY